MDNYKNNNIQLSKQCYSLWWMQRKILHYCRSSVADTKEMQEKFQGIE